jgi:3',5'-cyclic AMP phosphodiesterase CpdA
MWTKGMKIRRTIDTREIARRALSGSRCGQASLRKTGLAVTRVWVLSHILVCLCVASCAVAQQVEQHPLTVLAIGDAGETGSALRACGTYATDMYTGRHDGGRFDVMIFLGDNFYNIGLNGPADDAQSLASKVLNPFKDAMRGLGRSNVHAITGNHDYYSRNLLEGSYLFGLISFEDVPIGLTDKGNKRAAALPDWTYYYGMPAQSTYAIEPGSSDSVQFVFFDSALPLRTPLTSWRPALDSLARLLAASKARPGITWRIFCAHHPFHSVGEHGGFSVWNDETNTVDYLTRCDKDTNAYGWFKNMVDPEDLCAEKYRQYIDSVKTVIREAGVRLQLSLTGHDHSLQLLNYRDNDAAGFPHVHVVSGAGSKPSRVKVSNPPTEYTSAQTNPTKEGESWPGFVQLQFGKEKLRIRFFNAKSGDWLDMGGGKMEFWVDRDGELMD